MARKVKISVSVDENVLRRIDRVAKHKGTTRSAEISAACRDYVEDTEMMVKAFANTELREAFIRAFSAPEVVRQFASVMQEDLSDEQLRLFSDAMQKLAGAKRKKTSD